MKEIKLEVRSVMVDMGDKKVPQKIDDKVILKAALEGLPVAGTRSEPRNIAHLRKIDRVCDLIDNAKSVLRLEDADFDFLKRKVDEYGDWSAVGQMRKSILTVADKLDNAKEVKQKEKDDEEKNNKPKNK